MIARGPEKLKDYLAWRKLAGPEQLAAAEQLAARRRLAGLPGSLLEALRDQGLLTRRQIREVRAALVGTPAAAPEAPPASPDIPGRAPPGATHVLVQLNGEERGRRFYLADKPLVLGRGSDCDIQLKSAKVSARHARLERNPAGRPALEDLQSTNGTLVNRRRISRENLREGDRVVIAPYLFSFHALFRPAGEGAPEPPPAPGQTPPAAAPAQDPAPPPAPPAAVCPTIHLALLEPDDFAQQFSLCGTRFTLGRLPGCTVTLPLEEVAEEQAVIEYADGGFHLRPAGGPVQVNDRRVPEAGLVLAPGDLIAIAPFALRVLDKPRSGDAAETRPVWRPHLRRQEAGGRAARPRPPLPWWRQFVIPAACLVLILLVALAVSAIKKRQRQAERQPPAPTGNAAPAR